MPKDDEPIDTNALVEDEAVQAILGMNQKHILPYPKFFVFSSFFLSQSFPSYLPPSYLPPHFYLPHLILHSFHRQSLRELEVRAKLKATNERVEVAAKTTRLKRKPEMIGQSESLKISSFPSFHFFWFFSCVVLLQQRR